MTLVIIAAGMGSRYGGMKQIDPITKDGEFIIDFTVFDAIRAGFDKVVFVIKEEKLEDFKSTVGKRIEPHIHVDYAFQSLSDIPKGYELPQERIKPWGTAHAVLAARNIVKDNFAVVNADDFYGYDAFIKLADHLNKAKTENNVAQCCMIGYKLENTLTENGSVSRGQCSVSENGLLENIVERKQIIRFGNTARFEDNGSWTDIPLDTVVSMNCFGFTPEIFAHFEKGFESFLSEHINEPKSEFYCPSAVFDMIKDGSATVNVYNTTANWYGVTYHEDKPRVVAAIRSLIENGSYPENLWKNV